MKTDSIYAVPKQVTELAECHFYHTMHVPGHGVVEGEWDLRSGLHRYLGRVDLTDKRVLDLGTASGLVAFSVEKQANEVIAFDRWTGACPGKPPFETPLRSGKLASTRPPR